MRNFGPHALAPAYGGAEEEDKDEDDDCDGKTEEKEQAGDGDDDSDEAPDEAPPLRGLVSSQGISYGSRGPARAFSDAAEDCGEAEGTRWEPNMELDLGDFDQSYVTYLAEVSMCGTRGGGVKVRRGAVGVETLDPTPTAVYVCLQCTILSLARHAIGLTACCALKACGYLLCTSCGLERKCIDVPVPPVSTVCRSSGIFRSCLSPPALAPIPSLTRPPSFLPSLPPF